MTGKKKQQSALTHVLKALIPYTRENLALSFSPNKFFNDLEKSSGYNRNTLRNAYWRAEKRNYFKKVRDTPELTDAGLDYIADYEPKYLGSGARLIIIFDIPETQRKARQQLRELIKSWGFVQIQKSVWSTELDYRELLVETVAELKLAGCVEIFEGVRLFPK